MNQPCPKCKRAIPDGKLACPYCAIRASWQAIRRHQPAALLEVAAGRGRFTIHKKPSGNHAQMFSPWGKGLAARFFCGGAPSDFDRDKKLILAPEKKRYRVDYAGPGYPLVCEKCRAAIQEWLVEAQTAEAMRTA